MLSLAMTFVLAQSLPSPVDSSGVSNTAAIICSVINVGFAGVVGWYLLTKAIPKLQDNFRDELRLQREDDNKREDARKLEDSKREDARKLEGKEALQIVVKHCETEGERDKNIIKGELAGFGKVINDNREVMEEVRDALREFRDTMKEFVRDSRRT